MYCMCDGTVLVSCLGHQMWALLTCLVCAYLVRDVHSISEVQHP